MDRIPVDETLTRNISRLAASTAQERRMVPRGTGSFPSVKGLEDAMDLVKAVVFPDFFDSRRNSKEIRSHYIGVNLDKLYTVMSQEIKRALRFDNTLEEDDVYCEACRLTLKFIDELPEIKRLLFTDVEAVYSNDPAVDNFAEIILSYPVVTTMVYYRTAHTLLKLGVPVIPRVITELSHSKTGIDIHPGAEIGEYFAVDHGTGVVIGETSIIGKHVTIYQGVTLGAKNFTLDAHGRPKNVARHPIIEDNVTIYANATILGRITVGRDSVIGGNIWLTHSVSPGSRVLQSRTINPEVIPEQIV